MKLNIKDSICAFILCLGFVSAGLIACGNEPKPKNVVKDYSIVPEAFAEHRQMADAVDSLGNFAGTVVFPADSEIVIHGDMTGGLPEFKKFLEERKNGFNYIYKKFQMMNPNFEGKISFDATIDVCGDVFSLTEIGSTTGVPKFNIEIKNSLLRQKFPKTPQGHYTVSFTLAFVNQAVN